MKKGCPEREDEMVLDNGYLRAPHNLLEIAGVNMRLQLIRNATMRLEYGGRKIVTDPYLAAKHSRPSFTGKSPNPMVELPMTPQQVLHGAEMALITHVHSDHFDPLAQELLPKEMPILCQPGDAENIRKLGFKNVIGVQEEEEWRGIGVNRTEGQHGSGEVLAAMGHVSGFVLKAKDEPTVYWTGDTVLNDDVLGVIKSVKPDVILTHSCGAVWGKQVLIVMDAVQTVEVCRLAPRSRVVAIHMEALDHATVTRAELRRYATEHGVKKEQLLIPVDGETIIL